MDGPERPGNFHSVVWVLGDMDVDPQRLSN